MGWDGMGRGYRTHQSSGSCIAKRTLIGGRGDVGRVGGTDVCRPAPSFYDQKIHFDSMREAYPTVVSSGQAALDHTSNPPTHAHARPVN